LLQIFSIVRHYTYLVLSVIFGLPAAVLWGLIFGCVSFDYIWCIQPSLRMFTIRLRPLAFTWRALASSVISPIASACGHLLSRINVSHNQPEPEERIV
jgi:hypothetical protein